jgi:predicted RNA-binding Zn-ribbon protein involved in translation (DUF1610 family)
MAGSEEVGVETPLSESDIVFECPHCGKSLAIDQRGAGFVVSCPDCQARVQVPGPFNEEPLLASPASAPGDVERVRAENRNHYDEIGRELGLIQSALDRVVSILQEAAAENAPRR